MKKIALWDARKVCRCIHGGHGLKITQSWADIVASTAGAMYVECAADDIVAREFNHERAALRVLISVIPDIPAVASKLSAYTRNANRIDHLIQRRASLDAVKSLFGQHLLPPRELVFFIQVDEIGVQARRAFRKMQLAELSRQIFPFRYSQLCYDCCAIFPDQLIIRGIARAGGCKQQSKSQAESGDSSSYTSFLNEKSHLDWGSSIAVSKSSGYQIED